MIMESFEELLKLRGTDLNEYVIGEGGMPPQEFVLEGMDEQDELLFAAWAHGLTSNDRVVPHYALMLYIISHVSLRKPAAIEDALAQSYCWDKVKGKYALSNEGMALIKRFEEPPKSVDICRQYLFSRVFEGKTYRVLCDANGHKSVFIDSLQLPATEVHRKLKAARVPISSSNNWTPDIILDWLISDPEFTWIRI